MSYLGCDKLPAVDLLGLLQHGLRPLQQVLLLHGKLVHPRAVRGDLGEQLRVDLAVLDVPAEVVGPPAGSRLNRQFVTFIKLNEQIQSSRAAGPGGFMNLPRFWQLL